MICGILILEGDDFVDAFLKLNFLLICLYLFCPILSGVNTEYMNYYIVFPDSKDQDYLIINSSMSVILDHYMMVIKR
jgi:hypothetical protein